MAGSHAGYRGDPGTTVSFTVSAPAGVDAMTLVLEKQSIFENQVTTYAPYQTVTLSRAAGTGGAPDLWTGSFTFTDPSVYGYYVQVGIAGFGDPDSVSLYWLDQGAAGWRMDVAPWVSDAYWRGWRGAVIVLARGLDDQWAVTALNNSATAETVTVTLPAGAAGVSSFTDALDGPAVTVTGGRITVTVPRSSAWCC